MDDDAKDRIIEDINPMRGFRSELNRVYNESSAGKEDMDYKASKSQVQAIRSRITTHDNYKSTKFDLHDKKYIRVDEDNYKKVTEQEDVLKTPSGDVFIRDAQGKAHKKIKEGALDKNDS